MVGCHLIPVLVFESVHRRVWRIKPSCKLELGLLSQAVPLSALLQGFEAAAAQQALARVGPNLDLAVTLLLGQGLSAAMASARGSADESADEEPAAAADAGAGAGEAAGEAAQAGDDDEDEGMAELLDDDEEEEVG
jgi:hypothetical protein